MTSLGESSGVSTGHVQITSVLPFPGRDINRGTETEKFYDFIKMTYQHFSHPWLMICSKLHCLLYVCLYPGFESKNATGMVFELSDIPSLSVPPFITAFPIFSPRYYYSLTPITHFPHPSTHLSYENHQGGARLCAPYFRGGVKARDGRVRLHRCG